MGSPPTNWIKHVSTNKNDCTIIDLINVITYVLIILLFNFVNNSTKQLITIAISDLITNSPNESRPMQRSYCI